MRYTLLFKAKSSKMSSSKIVVLITGGNTGIGLEVVKALYNSATSYEVILGSRSVQNGEDAVAQVKSQNSNSTSSISSIQIDISSDSSIVKARDEILSRFGRLDTLVNNAGASFDRKIQAKEMSLREAWNASWDTNVSGTMVMTSEFVPLLLKSSDPRLLFVTSGTASLRETDNFENPALARINASPAAGWPKDEQLNPITSYRSAKTGLNMAMCEWHRILKNDGVKVWAISPGFLATGLGGIGVEQLKKVSLRCTCDVLLVSS